MCAFLFSLYALLTPLDFSFYSLRVLDSLRLAVICTICIYSILIKLIKKQTTNNEVEELLNYHKKKTLK